MAKQLHAQVDIQATPERVWHVLTDFAAYPEWNPFLAKASGTARRGERLTIRMQPVGSRGMTMRPTVLEADPGRQLRWIGHLLVSGVFDGEHRFTIEPLGQGRVRLVQQEQFRGLLVPLMARSLDRHTLPAFEQMNQALKRRAEQPRS
ncbi:MAG TPA: SRPBCC domain-containing protein [Actinomycetes bacterium]|jgi:hypothetical protein|nr:SRPBCC domain-containing protein [Actinomycetes bacterium]